MPGTRFTLGPAKRRTRVPGMTVERLAQAKWKILSVQDTARTLGLEAAKLEIRRAEDIAPAGIFGIML